MLTSGASAGALFFYGENLPTLKDFKARFQFQNTLLTDSQGRLLYDMADLSKKRGRRVVEPLIWPGHATQYYHANKEDWLVGDSGNGIPEVLQDATIATEDATFYTNPGFDPMSIVRAEYDNVTTGHIVSGASTITQQLVREYMLDPSPTLGRKVEEVILAAELTQKYPKSRILWYYMNSVPFGNLAYGAEAAAKQYFNTDVWNLDLAQSALLAGLPEAPSIYDPVNNLPAALSRMHYVLKLMCEHGFLNRGPDHQCSAAVNEAMSEPKAHHWKFTPPVTIKYYPHFVEYAIKQLQHLSDTVPDLHGRLYNGLEVQTTLDDTLQNDAQQVVKDQVAAVSGFNVSDGALVSMDLQKSCYGCIRAMVGSADYNNKAISGEINMADTPRQPGSSFKPFNYIYAFQHGLGPGTTVLDAPIAIPDVGNPEDGGWYSPINYDHIFHGVVTLRVALANSINVPAVKVEQYGASTSSEQVMAIANQAVKLGIRNLMVDNPHCCGWALTLGGLEHGVRLVEETAAYGAFAEGGNTVPPVAIRKIWDRTTHKLLWDSQRPGDRPSWMQSVQALDPQGGPAYAYLMNNVLSDNASRCSPGVCEFGLDSPLNLGRTVAAKTGTTNSFTDNWTVGYTPDIVTGVWVGNADNSPMIGSTGITGAAPIWHQFMLDAFRILKLPPKDFTEPPDVQAGSECRENTAYTTLGSTSYDIYVGVIPLCSFGDFNSSLPSQSSSDQGTANNQPTALPTAPPPTVAPAPTQPPPAATSAPSATQVTPPNPPAQNGPTGNTPAQPPGGSPP